MRDGPPETAPRADPENLRHDSFVLASPRFTQNCRSPVQTIAAFPVKFAALRALVVALLLLIRRAEAQMDATGRLREALLRIRTEYVEMPDLKLTGRQAQRLWNLSQDVCEAALAMLVSEGFLAQALNGAYVRSGLMRTRAASRGSLLQPAASAGSRA
jgi:hypothetical protein